MTQWYEALFTNYAEKYEEESFTKGTLNEVDFIENEIKFNKECRILDVGCGTGRHSIELAKRGYTVTGIDLSNNMLEKAKRNAKEAGVTVTFLQADARDFSFNEKFDLVIMLCEGGFSLMETDMMNFNILKNAVNSMSGSGKIIFNCLNALFPMFHSVRDFIIEGGARNYNGSFDLIQFREFSDYTETDDSGNIMELKCNERFYSPSEISFMLTLLGLTKIDILGCDIGEFKRDFKLSTDNYQMLVIAEK